MLPLVVVKQQKGTDGGTDDELTLHHLLLMNRSVDLLVNPDTDGLWACRMRTDII